MRHEKGSCWAQPLLSRCSRPRTSPRSVIWRRTGIRPGVLCSAMSDVGEKACRVARNRMTAVKIVLDADTTSILATDLLIGCYCSVLCNPCVVMPCSLTGNMPDSSDWPLTERRGHRLTKRRPANRLSSPEAVRVYFSCDLPEPLCCAFQVLARFSV